MSTQGFMQPKKVSTKKHAIDGWIDMQSRESVDNWDGSGISRIKEKLEKINKQLSELYEKRKTDSSKYEVRIEDLEIQKERLEAAIKKDDAGCWIGLAWILCLIISMFSGVILIGCLIFKGFFIAALLLIAVVSYGNYLSFYTGDDKGNDLTTWFPIIGAIIQPLAICMLCGPNGLLAIPVLMGGMFMSVISALPVIAAMAAAIWFFGR